MNNKADYDPAADSINSWHLAIQVLGERASGRGEDKMIDTLISKLSQASEGSRELDAEIAVAVELDMPSPMGPCRPHLRLPNQYDECAPGTYWLVQMSGKSLRTAPEFTGSVDAAMRLVPDDWWISSINQYHVGDWPADWRGVHMRHVPPWNRGEVVGEHKGPLPIAICIAALKARRSCPGQLSNTFHGEKGESL